MPAFIEHLEKIKTSGSDHNVMEIEYRLKNAKGDIRWFCDRNTVFKRNSHNSPVEKLGLSQDITIRKEQEEQLRTDIGILSQAEEITNMGTWEYDIDTGNFKWSDGMYRLFNLSREELLSPEIYFEYTLAEEKETVTRITDNITRHYNAFDETITLLPSGQEKKIIRIRAVPVKDKGKNLVKMVGVDLDITSQVQASEEINELNKILIIKNRDLEELNSELKTFNTVTASDFKDTLQLLYTNLEYIARNETRHLGDSAKANLRRAQSAIQKMKLLTDDINTYLQLYDIGINVSLIDPNPILEQILSGIQEQIKESNASIEVSQLPTLLADPYLFSRLLMQLIDNAFKFRKLIQPPVIKIKYSQADEMNVVPLALKNTPYTIISVADNGIGFDDNESEKIFELFYRIPAKIKYKGSGIGLAICKKIMAMHHGFITSEGRPANGAVFSCYFPMDKRKVVNRFET
jgi:signal transduction histidine kinase